MVYCDKERFWKVKIEMKRERKVVCVLGIIIGVFIVCWFLFFLLVLILLFCFLCDFYFVMFSVCLWLELIGRMGVSR